MSARIRTKTESIVLIMGTLLLGYAALCALLFIGQRSMIYFPTPEVRNAHAEDWRVDTGDASIQVWKLDGGAANAVIYFGGNAEDVSGNIADFSRYFAGHTIYLVNYRGYGASTGSPSEMGIIRDAEHIFDVVRDRHPSVTVVGRSLGSGVAMHLGGNRDVSRLILITPYDSLVNVAATHYPVFPVSLLLRDRFDSMRHAKSISVPTLVVAAEQDTIIPLRHARTLAEEIRHDLLEFVVIDGAGHNTIGNFAEYERALIEFSRRNDHQT